jgi:hypothetical protein
VRFCVDDVDDDVFPDCQNVQSRKSFMSECDLWWWSATAMVSPQPSTWQAAIGGGWFYSTKK